MCKKSRLNVGINFPDDHNRNNMGTQIYVHVHGNVVTPIGDMNMNCPVLMVGVPLMDHFNVKSIESL